MAEKKITMTEARDLWNRSGSQYSKMETTFENGKPVSISIVWIEGKRLELFEIEGE